MKDLAVTIWVTNDCNLLCEYCYVHKKIDYMSEMTTEEVVRFIKEKNSEIKPGRIKIVFSGGEPLLNFKPVKVIMDKLSELEKSKPVIYMMTTNGTITPAEEDLEYLKRISVSVSLDGMQTWNDKARKYKNTEMGSYLKAEKTIQKLMESGIPVRIRMTVTPENVAAFSENYKFLYKISHQLVAFEPDISDAGWNQDNLNIFFVNLKNIIKFMIETSREQAVEMIMALKGRFFHPRSECSGGRSSFHISADGKIYPCILATEVAEYELGNVSDGINEEKLKKFDQINSRSTKDCSGCSFYNNCESKTCKIVNKYYSGSYDTPSVVKCNIQNRMYKLLKEYKEFWEEKKSEN